MTTVTPAPSPLLILPSDLLYDIGERVCWDSASGWKARRVVPFAQSCSTVFTSVRSLVRSSTRFPTSCHRNCSSTSQKSCVGTARPAGTRVESCRSPSCRFIFEPVRSLVRSGIRGYYSPVIKLLRASNGYHIIRSIAVCVDDDDCDAICQCPTNESTCIAPFAALCQQNLVHLDLYKMSNSSLYDLAGRVDGFPCVRFLSVYSYS